MAKVFSYPNLSTPAGKVYSSLTGAVDAGVTAVAPVLQRVRGMTKVERRDFLKLSTAVWPCISLTEGVNPALRVSSDNPPQLLHGFVADFDNVGKKFTLQELTEAAARCAYPPTAAGPSLSGDGVHAVWLFKEAIPVLGNLEYARKVVAVAYSKLRVSNFMQGFDEGFKKPDRLLSIDPETFGFLTAQGEGQVVDEVSTRMWASNVTADFKFEGPQLDLKKVYEQVQKLFPGRWQGDFVSGARGVRFWDSSASDTTAAVVTEAGMVYFSDGGGFKPWGSILGSDVTSKLTADSLKEITEPWFYDDSRKEYVRYDSAYGTYSCKNRTQILDRLTLAGVEDDTDKKRALAYIEDHKSVTSIVTIANQPKGIVKQGPVTYLNTTQTCPVVPVEGTCDFTLGLMKAMFGVEQFPYAMAWLQDSFRSIQSQKPSYSQALFLAGEVACGKTLFQVRILTPLFGGKSADPMPHLIGKDDFNAELSDAGHWMVSDAEGARNADQRASFTQKIKAITANPEMSVRTKFRTPVTLHLNSRVSFSLNLLDECLGVLPRMGTDIMDKIMLFLIEKHNYFDGIKPETTTATIAEELPAFAWWLLNVYQAPAHVLTNGGRYHVKSYRSPILMQHAKASQDSSELLGWLNILFSQSDMLKSDYLAKGVPASFSAARWLQIINATVGTPVGMSSIKLSTHFKNLARQYPNAISFAQHPHEQVFHFSVDYPKITSHKE